jgi:hypothetical protein
MLNILKVMGNSTPIYIHWAFSSNLHVAHVHPCVPMCTHVWPMSTHVWIMNELKFN